MSLGLAAQAATPAVSAGYKHGVALHADGTVRAWGDDSGGQLGLGRTLSVNAPALVTNLDGVAKVTTIAARTARSAPRGPSRLAGPRPHRVPRLTGTPRAAGTFE